MPIRGEAERPARPDLDHPAQETACRRPIPLLAEHRVQQVPIPVDGAVEVAPVSAGPHIGLVEVPGAAGLAVALGAQSFTEQRRKADLPAPDRLMRHRVPTLKKQFRDISEAELVAPQPPEDGQGDNVGGKLEVVKGRSAR